MEDPRIPRLCLASLQSYQSIDNDVETFDNISSIEQENMHKLSNNIPLLKIDYSNLNQDERIDSEDIPFLKLGQVKTLDKKEEMAVKLLTFKSSKHASEEKLIPKKKSGKVRFKDESTTNSDSLEILLLKLPKENSSTIERKNAEDENIQLKAKGIFKDISDLRKYMKEQKIEKEKKKVRDDWDNLHQCFANVESKLAKHNRKLKWLDLTKEVTDEKKHVKNESIQEESEKSYFTENINLNEKKKISSTNYTSNFEKIKNEIQNHNE